PEGATTNQLVGSGVRGVPLRSYWTDLGAIRLMANHTVIAIIIALCAAAASLRAEPAKQAVPFAARPLPLSAVRITGGPLKRAQEMDAEYLLKLEPDRMLAYYRKRAGLAPKAAGYGGWDGDGKNLTGHIAGHYLSAVS